MINYKETIYTHITKIKICLSHDAYKLDNDTGLNKLRETNRDPTVKTNISICQ
jgi:hypothetical protein